MNYISQRPIDKPFVKPKGKLTIFPNNPFDAIFEDCFLLLDTNPSVRARFELRKYILLACILVM